MKITEVHLRLAAAILLTVPPLKQLSQHQPVLKCSRSKNNMGMFYAPTEDNRAVISVSSVLVRDVYTLMEVLAHELTHYLLYTRGEKDWAEHGKKFERWVRKICRENGLKIGNVL